MLLAFHRGYSQRDLRKIEKAITDHQSTIIEQYKRRCDENGIKPNYKNLS